MVEINKEDTMRTRPEPMAEELQPSNETQDIVSSSEKNRIEEAAIMRALFEDYEPIRDDSLRIIEVKRSVSRISRLDRLTIQTILNLKDELNELRNQLSQISETLENTSKICNATIYDLGDNRYKLTSPLQIVLEEDQEETVARIPELNLFATADTDAEAIIQLKLELINLYEDLSSSDITLGPLPKSWLETLKNLITKNSE